MIIFFEGPVNDKINLDLGKEVHVEIDIIKEPKRTFVDAIIHLASMQELPTKWRGALPEPFFIMVLVNFWSIGCARMTSQERRGLERIALGARAFETPIGGFNEKQTRYLPQVEINSQFFDEIFNRLGRNEYPGIGNHSEGNILIVGEKPGKNAYGKNTPFVGTGSGAWMARQLEAANIDEDKYYWINAKDAEGKTSNPYFLKSLKPKKIIALGNEAEKWADEFASEFPIVKVPHPAYWMRFKSGEEYPLLKELKL